MYMPDKDLISQPIEPVEDKVHRLTRSVLSVLPAGGALVELMQSVIMNPAEKRKEIWMEQVTDEINNLVNQEIVTLESLREDERFLSVFLEISNIAIRTHDENKRHMLKNAVVSAAKHTTQDETLESVLVGLVAQLQPVHLKLLQYVREPSAGSARRVLLQELPELGDDEDLLNQIWGELLSKGLVKQMDLAFAFCSGFGTDNCCTRLGDSLLDYISK